MLYIKNQKLVEKDYKLKVFLIIFITSMVMLLPMLLKLNGAFLYAGDFLSQTNVFNPYCNDAIKSGQTNWDWNNGLGTDFFEAFSYYTIGSPFFYLTMLFPSSWFCYIVAPIVSLKLGLAGLFAYIYMKQYVKKKESALLGSVLYAFSGWAIYNIFFYTFLDALIFLPLMLYVFDKTAKKEIKGCFALVLALCAINNFYFCYQICLFVAIYFFVKLIKKEIKLDKELFLTFSLEIVIGLLISSAIFLPSILYSMGMPRVANRYDNTNLLNLFYSFFFRTEFPYVDYTYLLENYLFHSMTPSIRPLFESSANFIWGGSSFALPIVSVVIFPNFIKKNKGHWLSVLLCVLIIGSFFPLFSLIFNAFSAAYLRWTFILTLFIAMMSVMVFEDKTISLKKPTIYISSAISLFLIIDLILPRSFMNKLGFPNELLKGEESSIELKIAGVCLVIVELLILVYSLTIWRKDYKLFIKRILSYALTVSIVAGMLSILPLTSGNIDSEKYLLNNYVNASVDFNDNSNNFRIGTSTKYRNLSYLLGYQCPETFQTATSNSSVDFYEYLGYDIGSAVMYYDNEKIFTFFGTKYFVTDKYGYFKEEQMDKEYKKPIVNKKGELKFKGYSFIGKQNGFNLYKNQNYLPYGLTYEGYYLESDIEKMNLSIDEKTALLFGGILVSDEDEGKVSKYYNKLNIEEELKDVSYERYIKDLKNIKSRKLADNFDITKTGFKCSYSTDKDNLLFFQIPYHDGWSAYVNGVEVDVIKSNIGFMSIPVTKGENKIVFKYSNVNRTVGKYVSLIGIFLYVFYICGIYFYEKKRKLKTN